MPPAGDPSSASPSTDGDRFGAPAPTNRSVLVAFTADALADAARERLNAPVAVEIVDAELSQAVDALAVQVGAPITVDWKKFMASAIKPTSRITVPPSERPVAQVLTDSIAALLPSETQLVPTLRVDMGIITLSLEQRTQPSEGGRGTGGGPGGSAVAEPAADATSPKLEGAAPKPLPSAVGNQPAAQPSEPQAPNGAVADIPAAKDSGSVRAERADQSASKAANEAANEATSEAASVSGASNARPGLTLDEAARATLARRLERSLIVIGLAAQVDAPSAADIARTNEPAIEPDESGRVLVTMTVEASEPRAFEAILAALRDAGVAVEATQPSTRLIIARVPMTELLRVALLPGLRRIEPLRATPDRS